MRLFLAFFSLIVTAAFTLLLAFPLPLGSTRLPALGDFFNPYTGFWQNAEPAGRSPLPERLELDGLSGPVRVVFDDNMAPHIFAQDYFDAIMVQGYLTAMHRLWQIDISARQTGGRLSEVFGKRLLEIDRSYRRRGLLYAAERDWEAWQQGDDTRRMLEAYAAGVNAWIAQMDPADLPLEYKLLGFRPEPWTPLKTCLIIESMIDNLNGRDVDLASTNSLALLGRDTFNYLYPEWFDQQTPVVPDTGQWKTMRQQAAPSYSSIAPLPGREVPQRRLPLSFGPLNGSNNWAVSGAKTQSGKPFLCDDMHLPLRLPHTWYQLQIHTPERNVFGVIVPGVPGVVVGFSKDMAWGFTNVSQEVADWYKIRWSDPNRTRYQVDGKEISAELRVEVIETLEGETVRDTVRYTRWGPVVHDDPSHPLYDHAYRYSTHDIPGNNDLYQFFNINKARTYEEYRSAITGLDCLSQNVAFASARGDIGITVQGKFPIRKPEQGRFLMDGSDSANEWGGFVPNDQLPSMLNPSRGFVFSANQHSTDPGYPYYYIPNFDEYRGRRIHDRLARMDQVTVDSMKSLQLDNYSMKARDALPVMLRLLDRSRLDAGESRVLEALENWDYRYLRDAMAPSYFEMWFDSTYTATWDEMDRFREKKTDVLYPDSWRFVQIMDRDPESIFFDILATPDRERAGDVVTGAFKKMAGAVSGMAEEERLWKNFKRFGIWHIARLGAFSRLDVETDGIRNAPNAISSDHGPSWRMIVEMTDPVRGWGIYPGGQSGNPGSRFYDNMVDGWAAGEYRDLILMQGPDDRRGITALSEHVFSPKQKK